jgi:hypothetical protein
MNNRPDAAKNILLDWARTAFPRRAPRSLGELAVRMAHGKARDSVLSLDRHLYGPATGPWQGADLYESLAAEGRFESNWKVGKFRDKGTHS